jgi:hypothetical protein
MLITTPAQQMSQVAGTTGTVTVVDGGFGGFGTLGNGALCLKGADTASTTVRVLYEKITWAYKDGNIIHADSWNERS